MRAPLAMLLVVLAACGGGEGDQVVVAAGTTLVDSRVIDDLAAAYEAATPGARLSVVGESTANLPAGPD